MNYKEKYMKFWKISGPEYNENCVYMITTSDCRYDELIADLDKIFSTPDEASYFIEEITRTEFDNATITW